MVRRNTATLAAEAAQREHDEALAQAEANERVEQAKRNARILEEGKPATICYICEMPAGANRAGGDVGGLVQRVEVFDHTIADDGTFLCDDCADRICSRCDHPNNEHGAGKCHITEPILMGDGTTEVHRCPCPGYISVEHSYWLGRPMETWSEDPQHASWAARHGMEFCTCGMPGTAHFRLRACPYNAAGEATGCTGFTADPNADGAEEPKVDIWPFEEVDGLRVLEHVIGFAGRVALAPDSYDHLGMWRSLAIDTKVTFTLTATIASTGAHVPIKVKGHTIGLAAVTKVKALELSWGGAPLPEAADVHLDELNHTERHEIEAEAEAASRDDRSGFGPHGEDQHSALDESLAEALAP